MIVVVTVEKILLGPLCRPSLGGVLKLSRLTSLMITQLDPTSRRPPTNFDLASVGPIIFAFASVFSRIMVVFLGFKFVYVLHSIFSMGLFFPIGTGFCSRYFPIWEDSGTIRAWIVAATSFNRARSANLAMFQSMAEVVMYGPCNLI